MAPVCERSGARLDARGTPKSAKVCKRLQRLSTALAGKKEELQTTKERHVADSATGRVFVFWLPKASRATRD
eukprot:1270919-Prymnesium_polylepis.1